MMWDFCDWLGESKYMYGLNTIPPSRFSNVSSNGLWEYSPFLCGVGLMEGLELANFLGIWIWDQLPEVIYMVHLHNILVQRGYIKQPVGLFASLPEAFSIRILQGWEGPRVGFPRGLNDLIGPAASRRSTRNRIAAQREVAKTAGSTINETDHGPRHGKSSAGGDSSYPAHEGCSPPAWLR
jgi:hypothetical protein